MNEITPVPDTDQAPINEIDDQMIADQLQAEFDRLPVDPMANGSQEIDHLHRYIRLAQRYAEELERFNAQAAMMRKVLEQRIERLNHIYQPAAEQQVAMMIEGRKLKSVKTPWGTVGFRTAGGGLFVVDEQAVLAQVEAGTLPESIKRVKIDLSKSALNEHYKSTGEIPDGVELVPVHQQFYIK